MIPVVALGVTLLLMLAELRVSQRHERWLKGRGAITPPDPVYPVMRWAYPLTFALLALAAFVSPPLPRAIAAVGLAVFVAAKLLKASAIAALGPRWTYRVYVLPGAALVTTGPYRWLRHPNYVGVVGELIGFALMVGALPIGLVPMLLFGDLLRRRVRAEEAALGLGRPAGRAEGSS